mgnify:CR=1 FL=1
MFIFNQSGNISVRSDRVSRFHVDENHNVFAYSSDSDETMLLGSYSTSDKALEAMVAAIDAVEAGKTYRMPADDAAEATTDPVEPSETVQPDDPDEANVAEPTDTMDDVPTAHGKHRGRAPSGKFSLFCGLYPDYLRGECGVTSMAREIGCSTATVYTYLRKMRAMVDATIAADAVTDRE